MPRRNLPSGTAAARKSARSRSNEPAGGLRSGEQVQFWRDVEYRVRPVAGAPAGSASRPYRCPGCDQLLAPGAGHLVAWPADDLEASDRRHWHTACWQARDRRAPGVQRSRNAPRYG